MICFAMDKCFTFDKCFFGLTMIWIDNSYLIDNFLFPGGGGGGGDMPGSPSASKSGNDSDLGESGNGLNEKDVVSEDGWLLVSQKKLKRRYNWQRKYFVLNGTRLGMFKTSRSNKGKGVLHS